MKISPYIILNTITLVEYIYVIYVGYNFGNWYISNSIQMYQNNIKYPMIYYVCSHAGVVNLLFYKENPFILKITNTYHSLYYI